MWVVSIPSLLISNIIFFIKKTYNEIEKGNPSVPVEDPWPISNAREDWKDFEKYVNFILVV